MKLNRLVHFVAQNEREAEDEFGFHGNLWYLAGFSSQKKWSQRIRAAKFVPNEQVGKAPTTVTLYFPPSGHEGISPALLSLMYGLS
jgi:hypothetical protein